MQDELCARVCVHSLTCPRQNEPVGPMVAVNLIFVYAKPIRHSGSICVENIRKVLKSRPRLRPFYCSLSRLPSAIDSDDPDAIIRSLIGVHML